MYIHDISTYCQYIGCFFNKLSPQQLSHSCSQWIHDTTLVHLKNCVVCIFLTNVFFHLILPSLPSEFRIAFEFSNIASMFFFNMAFVLGPKPLDSPIMSEIWIKLDSFFPNRLEIPWYSSAISLFLTSTLMFFALFMMFNSFNPIIQKICIKYLLLNIVK